MRKIGSLADERLTGLFAAYLSTEGITTQIEAEDGGLWAIWVYNEERMVRAKELYSEFTAHQSDAAYMSRLLEKPVKIRISAPPPFPSSTGSEVPWLSWTLILISCLISIPILIGKDFGLTRHFFITEFVLTDDLPWWASLVEFREGQIWRLMTPIFIHFTPLHLLFNMMWLKDLGRLIEQRKSPLFLLVFILVISVVSNVAQYAVNGPHFGGMSGIVYGLLGYVWMKGRYEPSCGLQLHPSIVTMMIAWFVLCLTGLLGPIANTVHAVGLGLGVLWGRLEALRRRSG